MGTTLLAIGDTHLHSGPRNDLRLRALDQIAEIVATTEDLGAIVWAGDLFHRKSEPADRNHIAARLTRYAAYAPVVICRGNHDVPGDLDILARLDCTYPVHVVTEPEVLPLRLATGQQASIAVLPYPEKGGLVGAGVAHGDLAPTAADLLDSMFMAFAGALDLARDAGDLVGYVGHHAITGARMSSGQPSIGREIEVPRAHLDRLGPILKIVNHIHLPQEIAGAVYPGSIAPMDWGETHQCRYLVVDMRSSEDFTITSQPIDVPRLYHVEGTLTREGFGADHDDTLCPACNGTQDGEYVAGEGTIPCAFCTDGLQRDWSDGEVRVRYRYRASERAILDEAPLRELFASAQRLKIESVVIPDRALRAPAVALARTLHDKLAAMHEDGMLPAGVGAKLAALEQYDPERILTDVRAGLAAIETPETLETTA